MARSATMSGRPRAFAPNLSKRGYCVVYREDSVNHCPGCGRTHWYVGRITAECGFCGTALPLAAATAQGNGAIRWSTNGLAA